MKKKQLFLSAAATGLMLGISACATAKNHDMQNKTPGKCHGVNSCKGTGACGGKNHSCAGYNTCKGKGWLKMTKKECKKKGGTFES